MEGPLNEQRGDYHAAQIVQALVAIFATKKGAKPPKLSELMLDFDPRPKTGNGLALLAKAAAANRAAGGIDTTASKLVTTESDGD